MIRSFESAERAELQQIRREYPRWGFLLVEGCWFAVHGRNTLIEASTADELRAALTLSTGPVSRDADTGCGSRPSYALAGDQIQPGVLAAMPTETGTWTILWR
ncbi:hypothetical protein Misp02_28650 [Microtetraspora sp. NBRC 16547]|nr:hypothetical protein Misp02_28650 [Microtetraspora sp. NBRC 16547]